MEPDKFVPESLIPNYSQHWICKLSYRHERTEQNGWRDGRKGRMQISTVFALSPLSPSSAHIVWCSRRSRRWPICSATLYWINCKWILCATRKRLLAKNLRLEFSSLKSFLKVFHCAHESWKTTTTNSHLKRVLCSRRWRREEEKNGIQNVIAETDERSYLRRKQQLSHEI